MKKIFKGVLIAVASFSLALPSFAHAEESTRVKCEMTIESGKHTQSEPAQANNECKDLIYGYYAKNVNTFNIFGMVDQKVTYSGQKFIMSVFSDKYAEAELTVYTKKTETNKPEPIKVLYKVRVTKNKSAIHSSNSEESTTVKKLNTNDVVEVVQLKDGWYKIKNGKGYAWIYNKYVSKNLTPQVLYKVRVTKNKSAIHTSNSGKSKTIKKLNTNDVISVVQSKGDWYKLKNGKGYAWIYNKYVSKNLTPQVLYKVRVTKNKSAIHTSNSGKSKTIKKLNTNDVISVIQSKANWYKLKNGKGYAWIYNKYVSKNLTPQVIYKGKVTTKSLIIRSSNTTKSKKIGTLKKNAKVQIVQSKSGWYKIKKGKGYGWVSSKYVKK
ncbi:SH3 domain-containing protein [Bacillus sporothermodurans]|uniref:SH3 domain-containing protein n=1 Tax=Heyndrickxia sporothermodurans TaxID=46224 RepID=UPI00192B4C7D|nr:SH3 domain-containing protein [Heyndrickxia sporothermodurans]MBL5800689.1 SH3 domain-containing protein [Heyndrickxia sporothermodurans]MBL5811771.1 SH3 domain-containing protein [Heyndrickxia sporothermodurans]MBL5815267.1 SH3 domain-containing protein [Heyndrickxia sporothermodurans]MBL5818658.1 SH3 domain-containing protein [Heyndrickxia sporothermodurans]MBL5843846.1 SH3 domain-containing protein [Heyndrickxia sporothermodurans]